MSARRPLSLKRKMRIWEAHDGLCHLCGTLALVKWEIEHIIPLALGGSDDDANMAPAHKGCHATKTKADVASIAKAKRQKARHIGIKRPSTFPKPPPGSRYDWKLGRRVFDT